jgi:hypothetical protein
VFIEWATIIEGGIPILGGLYATVLGYGVVTVSRSLPSPRLKKTLDLFRWLGPAVVLFGIFTAWQTHRQLSHPPAEELALQIARRLKFPAKVDETTQVVAVEGRGDSITYDYLIATRLAELGEREQVRGKLEQQWLSSACKTKDSQTLLRGGYTIQMRYVFRETAEPVVISIPPKACGY